jgi:predicted nucleic acid-binding protein
VGCPIGGGVGVAQAATSASHGLMLLLDSDALSSVAHGPRTRRDRVRALIAEMRARDLPVATVAAVLAELVRSGTTRRCRRFRGVAPRARRGLPGRHAVGVKAGQLLGRLGAGSELAVDAFTVAVADLALVLGLVAAAESWLPTYRISRLDPATLLRAQ